MHEENLSMPGQFLLDGAANQRFGKWSDHGLNGQAVLRRRFDDAHVAQTNERHIERAWNGSRRKRQDVDIKLELLEAFLVRDAKALLLIHNQEAEVVKLNVL